MFRPNIIGGLGKVPRIRRGFGGGGEGVRTSTALGVPSDSGDDGDGAEFFLVPEGFFCGGVAAATATSFPGDAAFFDEVAAAFLFLGDAFLDFAGLAGCAFLDFAGFGGVSWGESPPPRALRLDRRSREGVAADGARAMVACGDGGGAAEQVDDGCCRFMAYRGIAILWWLHVVISEKMRFWRCEVYFSEAPYANWRFEVYRNDRVFCHSTAYGAILCGTPFTTCRKWSGPKTSPYAPYHIWSSPICDIPYGVAPYSIPHTECLKKVGHMRRTV